jgi:hypothetical protein
MPPEINKDPEMPINDPTWNLERDMMPTKQRSSTFQGYMRRGGKLKKPGQWAIAGEDGPEIVYKDDDETEVIPLDNLPNIDTLGGFYPPTDPMQWDKARYEGLQPTTYGQPMPPPIVAEIPDSPQDTRVRVVAGMPTTQNLPEDAGFYPGAATPTTTNDPYARKADLLRNGVPKEKSWLKRAALGALRGMATGSSAGLGGAVGGAIAGAVGGGFFPKVDQAIRTQAELGRVDQEIGNYEAKLGTQAKQVQIQDRIEDNNRLATEAQSRAAARRETLQKQRRADWFKQNAHFDPSKATDAQKRQLAEFGETPESIGRYDLKDPKVKTIGDTTFRFDRNAGAWVDSGMPKDPNKASTEITATDPSTGKTYTFVTTQEKAAAMMNARTVAGLQIQAAKDRQLSQQGFQANENAKSRQFQAAMEAARAEHRAGMKAYELANGRVKTLERARASFVAAYQKAMGTPPSEEDISAHLNAIVSDLEN